MNRSFVVLACLLISIAQARSAFADQAADRFKEGSRAAKERKWDLCRAKLVEAWEIRQHWKIALNLGDCELKLGMYRDAAEHLSYGLRELPADEEAAKGEQLTAWLGEASAKIVTLTIKTDPPDAEVLLEGKSLGRGPFERPIFLDVRTYAIEIRAEGRKPFMGTIEGRPGLREAVDQRLEPVEPPPPPSPASPSPPEPEPKPKPAPPPIVPTPSEAPKPEGPLVLPLVIGGAAAVITLGVGVGLSVAANGKADDAQVAGQGLGPSACAAPQQNPAACTALNDALSARDSLSNGAVVSFVAGGVLALGTAGFAAWDWSRARGGTTVRVAPAVGTSGGGVAIAGSW